MYSLATLFINGSTGNILYRMNMALAFMVCGVFMIIVGQFCPDRYDMKDLSQMEVLRGAVKETGKAAITGAKIAYDNKENLIELNEKLKKDQALL